MSKRSYIPSGDMAFLEWAKAFSAYAKTHSTEWKVQPPDDDYTDAIDSFEHFLMLARDANRGKLDTMRKNDARKVLEKKSRGLVQGFYARNPYVTDVDREAMGLNIPDTIPTVVGTPVGLPTATFNYPNEGAVGVGIQHNKETPFDKRSNYGVKIRFGVFAKDALPVTDINLLTESRFTRRKKELFTFGDADIGKTMVLRLRYENSKGDVGQWTTAFSALIP